MLLFKYAMASKTTDPTKKTEAFFRDYIIMTTYAAISDVTDIHVSEGESRKYDPAVYQSYENLKLPKENRKGNAKNVFSVGSEVNQHFRTILARVVEDLQSIDCTPNDTIDIIKQNVSDDSYLGLVINAASKYVGGKILTAHVDPTGYIDARIRADLGATFLDKTIVIASVSKVFYTFVKCFAHTFAKWNWYTGDSMTESTALGLFSTVFDFSSDKIAELRYNKRPKVSKSTKKTAAKSTEVHEVTEVIEVSEVNDAIEEENDAIEKEIDDI